MTLREIIAEECLNKALDRSRGILGKDMVETEIYFDLARKVELGHKLPDTPRSRFVLDLVEKRIREGGYEMYQYLSQLHNFIEKSQ